VGAATAVFMASSALFDMMFGAIFLGVQRDTAREETLPQPKSLGARA
jgi:hypothetical protein